MTLDLDHLKQVAQNATQGPWEINSATCGSEYGDYTIYGVKDVADADWATDDVPAFAYCEGMTKPDATYIAAFDPPTVQALIARIEELEAENERLRERQESADLANEAIRWKREALNAQDAIQRVRELPIYEALDAYGDTYDVVAHDELTKALEGEPNG